eukprot:scaffold207_cov409-Prasinococcus_capsulatus_cf.AAC.35
MIVHPPQNLLFTRDVWSRVPIYLSPCSLRACFGQVPAAAHLASGDSRIQTRTGRSYRRSTHKPLDLRASTLLLSCERLSSTPVP